MASQRPNDKCASSGTQRTATVFNSPTTNSGTSRRNRLERTNQKRPNITSLPTPERKRTTPKQTERRQENLNLSNWPMPALTRLFLYLPIRDRLALSQTCRKLYQAEEYARRQRCILNVRLDLLCTYKDHLKSSFTASTEDVFVSTELFDHVMYRSMTDRTGSVCMMEKIACIDFGPPTRPDGSVDRARWGGRTFVTVDSLERWMDLIQKSALIELHLHHCYIPFDTLIKLGQLFVNLEKISVSLKGLEFRTTNVADLNQRLRDTIDNWSVLMKKKKKALNSMAVKELIVHIHDHLQTLETLILYQ